MKLLGFTVNEADKRFPFNSQEFAGKLGELIQDKFHKKVDLETPDLWVHVEILQRVFCFHFKSYPGLKGLPVGVSGRSCCLLSGGIDSPVASLKMMSRGSSQVFVHFHSFPMTTGESLEKVQALVQLLSQYQGNSPLYLVPFAEIQKEIVAQCRESLRILLYRRLMVRVAEVIAKKESALALVTGESLGQVASQTLVNMTAIGQAIELPILRPLLTYSKEEIIREARLFKTFEISTRPHEDCCTFLMPKNPSTNSPHSVLSRAEENFPMVQWLEHLVKSSEFKMIYPQTSS